MVSRRVSFRGADIYRGRCLVAASCETTRRSTSVHTEPRNKGDAYCDFHGRRRFDIESVCAAIRRLGRSFHVWRMDAHRIIHLRHWIGCSPARDLAAKKSLTRRCSQLAKAFGVADPILAKPKYAR